MSKHPNLTRAVAYANYVLKICLTRNCSCSEATARILLDSLVGGPENHKANILAMGGTAEEFAAGCGMVGEIEQLNNGNFGMFGVISAEWTSDEDIELRYQGMDATLEDIL